MLACNVMMVSRPLNDNAADERTCTRALVATNVAQLALIEFVGIGFEYASRNVVYAISELFTFVTHAHGFLNVCLFKPRAR